jgi:tetratricopeptide (TPR) repeat protein
MWRRVVLGLALAASIVAVYAPVRQHAFVEFDDPLYVRDNAVVQRGLSLPGVGWAFGSDDAFLWHPLTWLSLMADAELHGSSRAGPYALTNVALHVANSLLLMALLTSLTGRLGPSALAAALFALHPLRVESVAWVSGRKDGLSGLFALSAIWAYVAWARVGGRGRYLAALGLYVAALLAKPTHVALPLLLLLLDAWPLGRLRPALAAGRQAVSRLLLEKLPWLAVGLVAGVANVVMIGRVLNPWVEDLPFSQRLAAAPLHWLFYLEKTLWPVDLAIVYPGPHQQGLPFYGSAELAAGWALLVALSVGLAWLGRRRPYLAWGWLWFLIALAPALQLLPTGLRVPHDRYTWLASIGPFVALSFGGAALWTHARSLRPLLAGGAAALLAACAFLSAQQVAHWRDSRSLFDHSLAVTDRNAIVHFSRGIARARAGEVDAAIADLRTALAIHPRHPDSHNSLGYLLASRGEYDEAIVHLRQALVAQPSYALAMSNLGNVLDASGQGDEALVWLRRATERAPDSADAHYWLGVALERRGLAEAADPYRRALEIDPDHRWSRQALERLGAPG